MLREYGVTAVELGAQSMCDEVLEANERGHSAEDVRIASRLIRTSGIELGLQMMTGLYRDTPERCIYTAEEFIELAPATVRVYPTVVLKGTRLGELWTGGEYRSFGFEETVDLCAQLLRIFDEAGIRVIRMLGGVYHPALREIVESRIFLNDIKALLANRPSGLYQIYTDPKNISKAVGQKRCNIMALAELGYDVDVLPLAGERLMIK